MLLGIIFFPIEINSTVFLSQDVILCATSTRFTLFSYSMYSGSNFLLQSGPLFCPALAFYSLLVPNLCFPRLASAAFTQNFCYPFQCLNPNVKLLLLSYTINMITKISKTLYLIFRTFEQACCHSRNTFLKKVNFCTAEIQFLTMPPLLQCVPPSALHCPQALITILTACSWIFSVVTMSVVGSGAHAQAGQEFLNSSDCLSVLSKILASPEGAPELILRNEFRPPM